jgi:hypothetical protein
VSYNTDVNIVGSIPDYHLIYLALPLMLNGKEEIEKILVTNNQFDFRTESSRRRFLTVLKTAFVHEDKKINLLVGKLIEAQMKDEGARALILFWLFSINNKLFYELNRDVFLKYYFQGRVTFPKDEVVAYLKDLINNNPTLKGKWAEITIETIASKYLTILKKLGMLTGTKKKSFKYISISDELLAVFVHFFCLLRGNRSDILNDEFLKFSFVPQDVIIERFKKIGKQDWIKMNFSGTALKVEPSFDDKNIVHGIFG